MYPRQSPPETHAGCCKRWLEYLCLMPHDVPYGVWRVPYAQLPNGPQPWAPHGGSWHTQNVQYFNHTSCTLEKPRKKPTQITDFLRWTTEDLQEPWIAQLASIALCPRWTRAPCSRRRLQSKIHMSSHHWFCPKESTPPKSAFSPNFCSRQHRGRSSGVVVSPVRGVKGLSVRTGIVVDSMRVGGVPTLLVLPGNISPTPSQLVRQGSAVDNTGAVHRGWWWV